MPDTEAIRAINDHFRKNLTGGRVVATPGITERDDVDQIIDKVRLFDDFRSGEDPYGEHDFGAFDQGGQKIFWKIDYYDNDLTGGSPDPADETVTTRVLTIMLAEEY